MVTRARVKSHQGFGGKRRSGADGQALPHRITAVLADAPCTVRNMCACVLNEAIDIARSSAVIDRETAQRLDAFTAG